jgi:hypothetical protein
MSINIDITIIGKYKNITIEIDQTRIESGLVDEEEAKEWILQFEEAIEQLRY